MSWTSTAFDEYSGVDESWTYAYDYEGRLTQATKQSPVETETVTFRYGPFGRRIEKHVDDTVSGVQSLKTYAYIYDKEDVALEYSTDGAQTETTRYVHGPGIDEPLSIERDGAKYYYHADGLGSVTVLTDASQQIAERYVYDSFGNFTAVMEEVNNTFRFTGREWDEETGLYYYRARYYDPEVGRFISRDPIGFAGGDVNLYGYVGANPVNWVDPWGLEVIYGNIVVSNESVRNALTAIDDALPFADIIVTGGDRYIDSMGKVRSSSNNEVILNSAKYSTHLMGLGVDFQISNMTPSAEFLLNYFDWIKNDYSDGHIHGDLRNQGRFCTMGNQP